MITMIGECNALPATKICTNGFVNDSNHDIDFKIDGVIYDTLELYYSRSEANANVNGSVTGSIGYKINTSKTITITPAESEYRTTYGTDIIDSQLTYTIGGTVESADNTNNNSIAQADMFSAQYLTTKDPKNVTKAEGITSDNLGYLELSLKFAANKWGGYNYEFSTQNRFDTHVGYTNPVYIGTVGETLFK